MKVIADLHLHSRFSRAVSSQMTVPTMAKWAEKKGIDLLGSGDFTHPIWLRELKASLREENEGVYKLNSRLDPKRKSKASFLLSSEISCIYSQGGKTRKIHLVILAPNFQIVEKINQSLLLRGANLLSDGRPIVGLSAKSVAEIVLGASDKCLVIPAHAWTPHFSIFGSVSGFDSIEECFSELSPVIYSIETGLSSDPAMNWRIEELNQRSIVSFSDAHSPAKLGREATVLGITKLTFDNLRKALMNKDNENKISHTIEFYPEEGKYHYTGHRNCRIVYSPNEARKLGIVCPVCGKSLTVGVMSRVESLAKQEIQLTTNQDEYRVRWMKDKAGQRPPYVMLVPLGEIISEALESGVASQRVQGSYEQLVATFESEFKVLLTVEINEIQKISGVRIAEAVKRVRSGEIVIQPGYDGVFGQVRIWPSEEKNSSKTTTDQGQLF